MDLRIIGALGLILAGGMLNNGCENKEPVIVCFGDSLTEGFGASIAQSYPALLQQRVKVPVINAGVSGDTTADALARIQGDVLAHKPMMVIVEFGANDLLQGLYSGAIDTGGILARYKTILRKLADGNRKIFVVKFYVRDMIRTYPGDDNAEVYEAFEQLFASLEEEYPIEIIETIWDGIWGHPDLMFDDMHPNAAGYRKMAELYFKAIEPYLKEKDMLK
jgi:acyl-CoA thioesterase-1